MTINTVDSMVETGKNLLRSGDFEGCIAIITKVMDRCDSDDLAFECYILLASSYQNIGEYENARLLYEEGLSTRDMCQRKDESMVEILLNLAIMYMFTNNYTQALDKLAEAYFIIANIYGVDDHPKLAEIETKCARIYDNMGVTIAALDSLKEAATITSRAFGSDHKKTMIAYNLLGNYYKKLGKNLSAEKALSRAVKIEKKIRKKIEKKTFKRTGKR